MEKVIYIRVTDELHRAVKATAQAAGLSVQQFARYELEQACRPSVDERRRELREKDYGIGSR